MEQNRLGTAFKDFLDVALLDGSVAVDDHLIALDGGHLTGVLVVELLGPRLEQARGQLAAHSLLEVRLVDLDFLGKSEDFDNVVVGFKSDGPEQCGHRQFLLAVDVGIHHIVDVGCKLDPRPTEGDDARRVQLGAVGVHALSEENSRRPVQLRDHHTLGTVDDKGAIVGHIRDVAQIHVLNLGGEVHVVGVGTEELELCLERHAVSKAAVQALLYGVAGRVDVVVEEFKHKVVASVLNGKILGKHLIESFVFSFLSRSI